MKKYNSRSGRKQSKHLQPLLLVIAVWTMIMSFAFVTSAVELSSFNVSGLAAEHDTTGTWEYDTDTGKITGSVNPKESSGSCGGTNYSAQSSTLTISNSGTDTIVLEFNYTLPANGSLAIDDSQRTTTVRESVMLAPTDSTKITITSGSSQGQTASVTISDIAVKPADTVKVTFAPVSNLAYQVNGTPVSDDAVELEGDLLTQYALTTGAAGAGQYFASATWVSTDGTSQEVLYPNADGRITVPGAGTVTPVFVYDKNGIVPFKVGNVGFWTWESAFAAGASSTVVLNDEYTLPTTLADNGLTENGNYVTYDPSTGVITYIIPSGGKFLVPYDTGNTANFNASPKITSEATVKPFRTLTVENNTTILCNGGMNVNGQVLNAASLLTGKPNGDYGRVKLNGNNAKILLASANTTDSITTNDTAGTLYCYGFIIGTGTVEAQSGAAVYETFEASGFRGGTTAYAWVGSSGLSKTYKSFLFSDYSIHNIESTLKFHAGAANHAVFSCQPSIGNPIQSSIQLVGSTTGLFQQSSGSLIRTYDYYNDCAKYTIYGNASLSSFGLKLATMMGSQTLDTANYILGLNGGMEVVIAEDSKVSINNNLKLMPGFKMTVENDAKLTVNSNLYIYDAADFVDNYYVYYTQLSKNNNIQFPYIHGYDCVPTQYIATTEKTYSYAADNYARTIDANDHAELIVNGTLEVSSSGGVYTTTNGAESPGKVLKGTGTLINDNTKATADVSDVLDELVWEYYSSSDYSLKDDNINCSPVIGLLSGVSESAEDVNDSFGSATYYGQANNFWYQHVVNVDRPGIVEVNNTNGVATSELADADPRKETITNIVGVVANGGTITFTAEDYVVSVNGVELVSDENGVYTLSSISEDITLTLKTDCLHPNTEQIEEVKPTCTESGWTAGTKCVDCGEFIDEPVEVPATDHDWDEGVVTQAATCTVDGLKTFTCQNDTNHTTTEVIPATDHAWDEGVVTPPTCEAAGYTTYTCTRENCGATERRDTVPALEHDYKAAVTPPTCTEGGYTTYTCENCGGSYVDNRVDALEHVPVTDQAIAPTCTAAGLTEGSHCDRCGVVLVAQIEVPAQEHSYGEGEITTPASCKETGVKTFTCGSCGDIKTETIPALEHVPVTDQAVAPTCTADGKTEGSHCDLCGEVLVAQTEVPALGHDYNTVVTEPTCTEDGYTTYTCKREGCDYHEVKDIVSALTHNWVDGYCDHCETHCEHTYENGTCTNCGYGCAHENVTSEETKPTCTVAGTISKTCDDCGHSWTEEGKPALGHSWVEADCETAKHCSACDAVEGSALGHEYNDVVVAPTCTEDGYTTHTCTRAGCGYSYQDAPVAATGHTEGEIKEENRVEADCTTPGSYDKVTYCATCGSECAKETISIPNTGHTHVPTVTEPTCTEKGYTTYTCHCGDTYTADEKEATGHDHEAVVTPPTCTEKGYTTYTCHCGDTYTADEKEATGHSWKDGTCSVCNTPCEHTYVDGVCEVCGETEPVELFNIYAANMKMGNDLSMFFYVEKSNLVGTDYYAVVTKTYADGRENKVKTIPYSEWESYNTSLIRFNFDGIAAKEMADDIYVVIYDSKDNAISNVWVDSLRAYAMRALKAYPDDTYTRTMMVDMLNYGAAAQDKFNYNTDDLANNLLTQTQQSYASPDSTYSNNYVKGEYQAGTTLTYESNILLTMYFNGLTRDMYAEISFTDHYGKAQTVEITGDQFVTYGTSTLLGVAIDELVAADYKQLVVCNIYNADGTLYDTAVDSMESYTARVTNLHELFALAMKFASSAHAYLHKN